MAGRSGTGVLIAWKGERLSGLGPNCRQKGNPCQPPANDHGHMVRIGRGTHVARGKINPRQPRPNATTFLVKRLAGVRSGYALGGRASIVRLPDNRCRRNADIPASLDYPGTWIVRVTERGRLQVVFGCFRTGAAADLPQECFWIKELPRSAEAPHERFGNLPEHRRIIEVELAPARSAHLDSAWTTRRNSRADDPLRNLSY
jgi:hypothetical protein